MPRALMVVLVLLGGGSVARAQPAETAPPPPVVVDAAPAPPPIVQNTAPAPPVVVANRPLPPLVQNVPPPPVVQPQAPVALPPPVDVREEERRSGKLFLSALGTFCLSYGLTILAGAIRSAADDPAAASLYIPIVGPLVFWDGTNMEVDGETGAYLILSTGAQTVGILGMILGIVELTSDGPGDSANY